MKIKKAVSGGVPVTLHSIPRLGPVAQDDMIGSKNTYWISW